MVLNVFALLNLVLAAYAAIPSVSINQIKLRLSQQYNDSLIVANTTYEFGDNEMAHVECDGPNQGIMTFKVKDEPDFVEYINYTSINMYMRMRAESDGKYIDCRHSKSGVESIVRIMLKRKPTATSEGEERPENEDIICCSAECTRSSTSNTKNINGLLGLDFSRILYHYCLPMGYSVIHYEYKDQNFLDITWDVRLIAGKSNEYAVYWKDKLVSSLPVIKIDNDCRVSLKLKPITPAAADDRSVVKFSKSITDASRADHEEIRIILRRLLNGTEQVHEDSAIKISFFIPVGMVCFLAIVLIAPICFIVKRKSKVSRDVTDDHNYGNLENEGSINPFPSQWENYANLMERRDPDANSMGRLYATPLPKSQRKGQQNDTYVNLRAAAAPAAEGLYSVVERCNPAQPAPCLQ